MDRESRMNDADINVSRMLCPIDFSETSRRAFYQAVALAAHFEAELTVLHVQEHSWMRSSYEAIEAERQELELLEASLQDRLQEVYEDGTIDDEDRERIRMDLTQGKPWLEIVRYAVDHEVDMIVMGTHGRTGLEHMLIGSQAEKVVRWSPCRVLTVKPHGWTPDMSVILRD